MAERRESVRVSASGGDFSREFNKLAAEAVLLREAIKSVPDRVTVKAESRGFDKVEREARAAERSSSLLVDSAAALWPALLPVAALGVPAIAGLTAQLGFGLTAVGAMVLAFHGMGDALKALDQYQLHPTAQNLAKLNDEMSKLGPSGRDFVHELDRIEPQLKSLKMAAEDGLLPGATDGIEHLLTLLPQLRRIISEVSGTTGGLLSDLGENLAGPEFRDFFDFLEAEAPQMLDDLGRTLGNFAAGFAHLFVGLAPMEHDFSQFMLDVSQGFDDWANGIGQTQGFQDFLTYLDDTGPDVADALGSIGGALISVARAGAPLSGPVLQGLASLADILDKIASSPVGTPLVTMAAGLALINRALSIRATARGSLVGQLIRGESTGIAKSRAAVQGLTSDLIVMRGATQTTGKRSLARDLDAQAAAAGRVRSRLQTLGKGTAVVAGLALATSDLGDKFALTNTASLALMGSIAGIPGVIAGGAIGAIQDYAAANDDLEASIARANNAIAGGDQKSIEQAARMLQHVVDLKKQAASSPSSIGRGLLGQLFAQEDIRKGESALLRVQGEIRDTSGLGTLLTQGLGGPVAELGRELDTAAAASKRFFDSFDAANEKLDLRAALRAQAQAVRDFRKTMAESQKLPAPQRGAARNEALDQFARASLNVANLTKNPQIQTGRIADARKQFLQLADAMGYSDKRARFLATSFGLVDRTHLGAKNAGKAQKDLKDVAKDAGRARNEVADLGKKDAKPKAHLDHKKFDEGNAFARHALAVLDGQTATAHVNIKVAGMAALAAAQAGLNSFDGRVATAYTQTKTKKWAGGPVWGPGGPTDDLIPAMLSNGEFVVNARAYAKYARQIEWMNAQGFANGGRVSAAPPAINLSAPALDGYRLEGGTLTIPGIGAAILQGARLVAGDVLADHVDMVGADSKNRY